MSHSIKRATVRTVAARNKRTSDKFEHNRAALTEVETEFEIGLLNVDTCHANSKSFIPDYASFYKNMAHRSTTKNKTTHLLHITKDFAHNSLCSRAVCLSKPESVITNWAQTICLIVSKWKAVDFKCLRIMTTHKD